MCIEKSRSIYSKVFDKNSVAWTKNDESNRLFLKLQQHYANELLKHRKYLLLNEVYDMLGLPKTEAGEKVGWVYGNKYGDNYVDFGLVELFCDKGPKEEYILDFNVDGRILI